MAAFRHHVAELESPAGAPLRDADLLSAVVVAAASAIGLPAEAPPLAKTGPTGVVVVLACRDGHIAVHTDPDRRRCLVDVVTRLELPVQRAAEVIARRLGAELPPRG